MNLELDHVFILVEPGAKIADALVSLGVIESFSRVHPGQGTSNRRFPASNSMLEFLWVRDENEANNGPGRDLGFPERTLSPIASPFGVILTRTDNVTQRLPFNGWSYQPDYFDSPNAFWVGENSTDLAEPLCFYVPFMEPVVRTVEEGMFANISHVNIQLPTGSLSEVLEKVGTAERLSIEIGDQHLMEVTYNNHERGLSKDFRPETPLVVYY